ncbi:MAG: flagellar assembly protein FliW [Acidobacteriota bacterium]
MSREVATGRFGNVRYEDRDVIRMVAGMPGFESLRQFLLIDSTEYEPVKFLQSLEEPRISFPLIDPRLVRSDYRVSLDAAQQESLGLDHPGEGLVYSILTLGDNPAEVTANLFAPVVINLATMKAAQIILFESEYSVEEPVLGG